MLLHSCSYIMKYLSLNLYCIQGEEGNFLVRLSSSGEENKYSLSVL